MSETVDTAVEDAPGDEPTDPEGDIAYDPVTEQDPSPWSYSVIGSTRATPAGGSPR